MHDDRAWDSERKRRTLVRERRFPNVSSHTSALGARRGLPYATRASLRRRKSVQRRPPRRPPVRRRRRRRQPLAAQTQTLHARVLGDAAHVERVSARKRDRGCEGFFASPLETSDDSSAARLRSVGVVDSPSSRFRRRPTAAAHRGHRARTRRARPSRRAPPRTARRRRRARRGAIADARSPPSPVSLTRRGVFATDEGERAERGVARGVAPDGRSASARGAAEPTERGGRGTRQVRLKRRQGPRCRALARAARDGRVAQAQRRPATHAASAALPARRAPREPRAPRVSSPSTAACKHARAPPEGRPRRPRGGSARSSGVERSARRLAPRLGAASQRRTVLSALCADAAAKARARAASSAAETTRAARRTRAL